MNYDYNQKVMKRYILTLIATALAVLGMMAGTYTPESVPNVQLKDRTQLVSNPDGLLSAAAVDTLNRILLQVREQTTAEPVVVAIDDIDGDYDPNTFANELFTLWGIGKKDTENGLLLLLVGDAHRAVVRTGRGLGGILPDVTCSQILRHQALPLYKEGNLDGGTIAAVRELSRAMTDPVAAEEIRSKYADATADDDDADFFAFMLYCGLVAGIGSLIWVVWMIFSSRGKDDQTRYRMLNNGRPVLLFLAFMGLGMPLPAYLLCVWKMKRLRDHSRSCPNCGHAMRKLDEATDNEYLTPAQDMEEQLNSIDYDVWLCDQCGERDIIPYVNRQSAYTECQHCGARTCVLSGDRIIQQPTTRAEGRGVKIYSCRNCGKQTLKPYNIAKVAAAPVVIFPGGGGGFGGGGGISGGGFGGGGTSGGGASVGW